MATSLSTWAPSNTWFLRPIRAHNSNGIPIDSAVFAQTTVKCPYTLQWDAHSPQKNLPLSMGGSGPPSNTWFPGPTQDLNRNGSSIGSAVFAGLTSVTERPTDRPTDHATRSVRIGRIYVRSTAMRPNNKARGHRCFTKDKPHAGRRKRRKMPVLTLVTLTFDVDIQTRPSEGSNTSSQWISRKSVQPFRRCPP